MQSSSVLKVLLAFVVGVVVALGGAMYFVRVGDTNRMTQPVVHNTPAADADAAPQQTAESAPPATTPAIAEKSPAPSTLRKEHPVRRHKAAPHPAPTQDLTTSEPVVAPNPPATHANPAVTQIAQNTPPPKAAADPQPGPTDAQDQPVPAAPALPPPPQPHVVTLQPGTNVIIRLGETLSTNNNYTGDTFRGTLDSQIIADGFIIADKGSRVLGRIVEAEKPGRVRGTGFLSLTVTEINTTDGQRVRIATNSVEKSAPGSGNEDAAKIAGGAALGAIIGAIAGGGKGAAIGAGVGGAAGTGTVLATRGKPAILPTESRLTFQISSPVTITEKLK